MLEHLDQAAAARRLMAALEEVCRGDVRTRDIGGTATTVQVGDAVVASLSHPTTKGAT
jgi:tartrate dehydrogenase/decarboxylase / D-malate dehydrogenase